jgi:hypothetical protein
MSQPTESQYGFRVFQKSVTHFHSLPTWFFSNNIENLYIAILKFNRACAVYGRYVSLSNNLVRNSEEKVSNIKVGLKEDWD